MIFKVGETLAYHSRCKHRLVTGRVVSHSQVIQFDVLSPFRPCGSDLVEFFNSTGWAFYVKLA